MKKKEKKTSKSRKRTSPIEKDLIDIGLEPPKIYRESQKTRNASQERKINLGTQRNDNQNLTRAEKRVKETKKRKKRNKLRNVLIWIIAVIVFLAIGVVLSLTMFFNINNVTVEGNKLYSVEDVLAQCTIDKGENLFMSDTEKAKKTIEQNLPYVYNAQIKRKLPDTLQINITEAKPAYSIRCKDKTYILLDNRFKVLEVGSQVSKGIKISKAEVKSAIPGKQIVFKNADVGECLKKLGDTVKNGKFSEITAIYCNNISDNYVIYQDRIKFKLGNCDNLETKIYQGLAACEQLNESSPNVSGIMTIGGDKSVCFTEE